MGLLDLIITLTQVGKVKNRVQQQEIVYQRLLLGYK